MSLLHATGLKRHYGAQEVLRGADLRIESGDKIGVVGRNGAGKTTLLRLIEGEERPDAGELHLARGARLGYVNQRPSFAPGQTVRQYVETGLDEMHALERELDELAHAMGEAQGEELERLMTRHGHKSERFEFLGGWEGERRVETVLSGIGLEEVFWEREARTLSGGEKSRAALARELVSTPDLLLLDEPSNHLDLAGIEWIEEYIQSLRGAVVIVSHDRRLLDRAVGAIIEIERGELRRYPGGYSNYLQLREERFRSENRAWEQQRDMLRKETSFIKKHMGSQRTAEAKGRQKRLSRVVRLVQPHHDVRRPVIRLAKAERGGELVLEATELTVGYGDNILFENETVRIGRGERIGVVGPNGAGKTTLLKVLAGRMQPIAGKISTGHRASAGYYDQEISELDPEVTPFVTIRRHAPQMTDQEIRSHLAKFLFRGEEVDWIIGTLSGGERARVYLARLMLTEPSWLAFDEPTNHLDLAARTAIEEFLGGFQGALVTVSHDREFLDGLCTTIIEVADGRLRRFNDCNYSQYRARILAEAEERGADTRRREEERKQAEAAQRKKAEERAAREQARGQKKGKQKGKSQSGGKGGKGGRGGKGTVRPRNPYLFKKLEEAIIALEERREGLLAELASEAVYRDAEAMRDKQFELAEIERDLEDKNREWEGWS